ncbi:MAG: C-type lectin domain-containing protein [Deltaproteobacteria bacterium]|nr:C-type lectin domain-containing protein [Deltaproteobacteria bacterium]
MTRFLPLSALLLTGCMSNWTSDFEPPEATISQFYKDADGDGWGEFGSEPRLLVKANVAEGYTARNALDCDDADETITGKVGSICPAQAVVQESGDIAYAGYISPNGSEYLIFKGSTTEVWAAAAEKACGPIGWGTRLNGRLASFSNAADATAVIALLDTDGEYLLNITPGAQPAWVDGGDNALLTAWGWCSNQVIPSTMEQDRMVLRKEASGPCLTLPSDKAAHFICQRDLPTTEFIAEYDVPTAPED